MRGWKQLAIAGLGVAISGWAILSIFNQVGADQLLHAFQTARYEYVLLSLVIILLGLWARGVRWRVLLNDELPTGRSFFIMNIGYMVNGLLPLRLGEVGRAYLAYRAAPSIPVVRAISTIVVERILDLLSVLVIMAIAIASAPVHEDLRRIAGAAAPTAVIGFFVLVGMSAQRARTLRLVHWFTDRIAPLKKLDVARFADHFLDGLTPLTQPRMLFQTLLWTVIAWGFSLLSGYVLMPAFFGAPDWIGVFLFSAAASFANALPAAPGSLGTYEYSILISFQSLGYQDAAVITGFAVMIHALNLGANAVLGIIGFVREGLTLNQLTEQVRGIQQPSS